MAWVTGSLRYATPRNANNMITTLPAYVVVEIPEPIRDEIQSLRDELATPTSRLPVEITLFGSSGVGPIPSGTSVESVVHEVESVFSSIKPWDVVFDEICVFPNTSIAYLSPVNRSPFDRAHRLLRDSKLPRSNNEFPYNPHCTLRSGSTTEDELSKIVARDFPTSPFVVDTISVYDFDNRSVKCNLVHQMKLP